MAMSVESEIITEEQLNEFKALLITKAQLKKFKAILEEAIKYPNPGHEVLDTDGKTKISIEQSLRKKMFALSIKRRFYVFNIDDLVGVISEYQDKYIAGSTLDLVITYFLEDRLEKGFAYLDKERKILDYEEV